MSVSLKKRSRKRKAIDRPFDASILAKAREIVQQYQIILHYEEGDYYGRALELPHVMNDGRTPDECVAKTRDILTTAVAFMLEQGETPPPPMAVTLDRTQQVNIRLTAEEKLLIEQAARSRGFRGVSDFVRTTTLAALR